MFKIYQTIYFSLLHLWPNNNKTFGGPFNKYSVNGLDAILGGSFSKVREQKIVPLGIRIWRPWLTQLALKRRAINHHCTPAVSSIYEIIKQVSSSIQRCYTDEKKSCQMARIEFSILSYMLLRGISFYGLEELWWHSIQCLIVKFHLKT